MSDTERQIAALCWRKNPKTQTHEFLLITSRETRRWVIPKGWPMDGLKDWNAARREAFEEAGAEGRMSKTPIGQFHYLKRKRNGAMLPCDVDVYAMQVEKLLKRWPEEEERKREWFNAEDATERVQEDGLKELISKF